MDSILIYYSTIIGLGKIKQALDKYIFIFKVYSNLYLLTLALLPQTKVAVKLSLLVCFPLKGKHGSWRVMVCLPPLFPLTPSNERHVLSKLMMKGSWCSLGILTVPSLSLVANLSSTKSHSQLSNQLEILVNVVHRTL